MIYDWGKFENINSFSGEVDPKILAKCDLCHNDPCQNGATCRPLPNRDYECGCAPGFYGKNCDAVIGISYVLCYILLSTSSSSRALIVQFHITFVKTVIIFLFIFWY